MSDEKLQAILDFYMKDVAHNEEVFFTPPSILHLMRQLVGSKNSHHASKPTPIVRDVSIHPISYRDLDDRLTRTLEALESGEVSFNQRMFSCVVTNPPYSSILERGGLWPTNRGFHFRDNYRIDNLVSGSQHAHDAVKSKLSGDDLTYYLMGLEGKSAVLLSGRERSVKLDVLLDEDRIETFIYLDYPLSRAEILVILNSSKKNKGKTFFVDARSLVKWRIDKHRNWLEITDEAVASIVDFVEKCTEKPHVSKLVRNEEALKRIDVLHPTAQIPQPQERVLRCFSSIYEKILQGFLFFMGEDSSVKWVNSYVKDDLIFLWKKTNLDNKLEKIKYCSDLLFWIYAAQVIKLWSNTSMVWPEALMKLQTYGFGDRHQYLSDYYSMLFLHLETTYDVHNINTFEEVASIINQFIEDVNQGSTLQKQIRMFSSEEVLKIFAAPEYNDLHQIALIDCMPQVVEEIRTGMDSRNVMFPVVTGLIAKSNEERQPIEQKFEELGCLIPRYINSDNEYQEMRVSRQVQAALRSSHDLGMLIATPYVNHQKSIKLRIHDKIRFSGGIIEPSKIVDFEWSEHTYRKKNPIVIIPFSTKQNLKDSWKTFAEENFFERQRFSCLGHYSLHIQSSGQTNYLLVYAYPNRNERDVPNLTLLTNDDIKSMLGAKDFPNRMFPLWNLCFEFLEGNQECRTKSKKTVVSQFELEDYFDSKDRGLTPIQRNMFHKELRELRKLKPTVPEFKKSEMQEERMEDEYSEGRDRLKQEALREDLLKRYAHHCVITGYHSEFVLDAAHIIPYRECKGTGKEYLETNAILLHTNLHTLFDRFCWRFDIQDDKITLIWLDDNPQKIQQPPELKELFSSITDLTPRLQNYYHGEKAKLEDLKKNIEIYNKNFQKYKRASQKENKGDTAIPTMQLCLPF